RLYPLSPLCRPPSSTPRASVVSFFYCSGAHRDLHSFPTRRSSDLSWSAGCGPRPCTHVMHRLWTASRRTNASPHAPRAPRGPTRCGRRGRTRVSGRPGRPGKRRRAGGRRAGGRKAAGPAGPARRRGSRRWWSRSPAAGCSGPWRGPWAPRSGGRSAARSSARPAGGGGDGTRSAPAPPGRLCAAAPGGLRCLRRLRGLGRRGGGLHLLLVRPDLGQRLGAGDVGDRAEGLLLAVGARGLPPAGGAHPELLAQQGEEDLGLLLAEPGQLLQPLQQLRSRVDTAPDGLGVTVVVL